MIVSFVIVEQLGMKGGAEKQITPNRKTLHPY